MRSHSRAIHNNRAIPSRIIRNRGMDSNRITRSKVEGIKLILSRGMANNRDTLNKVIPNKVMPNSKTISNRAMDNHLPGMLRPKKLCP